MLAPVVVNSVRLVDAGSVSPASTVDYRDHAVNTKTDDASTSASSVHSAVRGRVVARYCGSCHQRLPLVSEAQTSTPEPPAKKARMSLPYPSPRARPLASRYAGNESAVSWNEVPASSQSGPYPISVMSVNCLQPRPLATSRVPADAAFVRNDVNYSTYAFSHRPDLSEVPYLGSDK